ncbi:hypothetical protein OWM07_02630 [Deferribacter thermophilus]|uniref:hypothetical protein n=1 Tax=Deferribacter thermophilus TaxID=53573 RepID=UPI003C260E3F
MNKEALLELKKEITIIEDFSEELGAEELDNLENVKAQFDKNFNLLSDDEKRWLNTEFFKWLEIYINDLSCKSHGCSTCSGGCDIEF